MAVTRISPSAMSRTPRRFAVAPRVLEHLIGNLLELMIHSVESWRDRRDRLAR